MKALLLALSLTVSSLAANAGEISSYGIFANVFLWRGQQFNSAGAPSVAGGMIYNHDSGFSAGVFANNLTSPFLYEFNHWLAYTHSADGWSITGTIYRYYVPLAIHYSTVGYRISGTVQQFNWMAEYMPEYFYGPGFSGTADTSSDIYVSVEYVYALNDKVSIVPQVGRSTFSDEHLVGQTSYTDYSLALRHTKDEFTAELGWVGTDRKVYDSGPTATTGGATSDAKEHRPYLKVKVNF